MSKLLVLSLIFGVLLFNLNAVKIRHKHERWKRQVVSKSSKVPTPSPPTTTLTPATTQSTSTTGVTTSNSTAFQDVIESEIFAVLNPELTPDIVDISIGTNVSYVLDLDVLFEQIERFIPIITKKLQKEQKKRTELSYFKEKTDYFYLMVKPPDTFSRMLKVCRRKGSEFFEVSTIQKFRDLQELTDRENKTLGVRTFWLNVIITNAGTVEYVSKLPLVTVLELGETLLELPTEIEKGKCIYFNTPEKKYKKTSCIDRHIGICYIEKTPEVLQTKLFYDTLDDMLKDVPRTKVTKLIQRQLTKAFESLPSSTCESSNAISLLQSIGFNEPINSLMGQSDLNPTVFTALFPQLLNDINTIRELARNNNFEEKLRFLIQSGENMKLFYDQSKKVICPKPSKLVAVETVETELEKNETEQFFKFNLTDLILAGTSLIIAIIAVANSLCLLVMSKCKKTDYPNNEIVDLGLSEPQSIPLLSKSNKKVSFTETSIDRQTLEDRRLSMASLPSPVPARSN